jgi:hypothetical protein
MRISAIKFSRGMHYIENFVGITVVVHTVVVFLCKCRDCGNGIGEFVGAGWSIQPFVANAVVGP